MPRNSERYRCPRARVADVVTRSAPRRRDRVEIKWVETGGPEIAAPVVRKFGSIAIERNLERAIGGKVTLEFPNSGVRCDIAIPSEHLVSFFDHQTA